jgi:hypothetical protein
MEVIQTAPHNADGGNKDTQPPQMRNPMGSRQRKRMLLSKPEHEPPSFNTDKLIHYLQNRTQHHGFSAAEHIFLGYAKPINTFSPGRQVEAKMKIAAIMMELELQHIEETSGHNSTITYTPLPQLSLSPRYTNHTPSTHHSTKQPHYSSKIEKPNSQDQYSLNSGTPLPVAQQWTPSNIEGQDIAGNEGRNETQYDCSLNKFFANLV